MDARNTVVLALILLLICNGIIGIINFDTIEEKSVHKWSSDQVDGKYVTSVTRFEGGDGSVGNPYQISNVNQLQDMNQNLRAHYILIKDIDASETGGWNHGMGFEPIAKDMDSDESGFQGENFTGSLDGYGFNITGLFIRRMGSDYIGLFGYLNKNASISNVSLLNVNINGGSCVGSLVGFNNEGSIICCHMAGNVVGQGDVGGLVGKGGSLIQECSAIGNVVSNGNYIGGLIGGMGGKVINCYTNTNVSGGQIIGGLAGFSGGQLENCSAMGDVNGNYNYIGGLIGWGWDCNVNNCYAMGEVGGKEYTGGLIGFLIDGMINNSFSTGNVSGTDGGIGGLVGVNRFGTMENCYAVGTITGDSEIGGLAGYNDEGFIRSCYTNGDVYGTNDHIGGIVGWNEYTNLKNCTTTGDVNGNDYVGGIVGRNGYGFLENCTATGDVSGNDYIGGMIGYSLGCRGANISARGNVIGNEDVGGLVGYHTSNRLDFLNCYATGNVSGSKAIGGLFGNLTSGILNFCYSEATVSGDEDIGGLVGFNLIGEISDCYGIGAVDGSKNVGGLVGNNRIGTVSDCYGIGAVDGGKNAGGLVGNNMYGTVSNCYSAGTINGSINIGGLVGLNGYEVEKCFWDTTTSGQLTSDGGTGKTTTQMRFSTTFTNAGWKFPSIWNICEGSSYPYLQSMDYSVKVHSPNVNVINENDQYLAEHSAETSVPGIDRFPWDLATNAGEWLNIDDNGILEGIPLHDDVGVHWVNVSIALNSGLMDFINFTLTVNDVNTAPRIIPINPVQKALEDHLFVADIEAVEPDDDTINWSFNTDAPFLDFDSLTGNLSGTANNSEVGTYWVNISVEDGNGASDFLNFTLEVINVNDEPIIRTPIRDSVYEDSLYHMVFEAVDIDPGPDILTWLCDTNAPFLDFDPLSVNLSGTPDNDHVGDWWVGILVDDGAGGFDYINYTLTVINMNDIPVVLSALSEIEFEEDTAYAGINLSEWFTDEDNDTLKFSCDSTDNITVVLSQDSLVTLTPIENWCGVEEIIFCANDSTVEITHAVRVIVTQVNDAPVDASITLQKRDYYEGKAQPAHANATDADMPYGDSLIFKWSFDSSDKTLTGKEVDLSLPAGEHIITLTVMDMEGESTVATLEVTILERNGNGNRPSTPENDTNGISNKWIKVVLFGGIGIVVIGITLVIIFLLLRKRSEDNGEYSNIPIGTPQSSGAEMDVQIPQNSVSDGLMDETVTGNNSEVIKGTGETLKNGASFIEIQPNGTDNAVPEEGMEQQESEKLPILCPDCMFFASYDTDRDAHWCKTCQEWL